MSNVALGVTWLVTASGGREVVSLAEEDLGFAEEVVGIVEEVLGLAEEVVGLEEEVVGLAEEVVGLVRRRTDGCGVFGLWSQSLALVSPLAA